MAIISINYQNTEQFWTFVKTKSTMSSIFFIPILRSLGNLKSLSPYVLSLSPPSFKYTKLVESKQISFLEYSLQ